MVVWLRRKANPTKISQTYPCHLPANRSDLARAALTSSRTTTYGEEPPNKAVYSSAAAYKILYWHFPSRPPLSKAPIPEAT